MASSSSREGLEHNNQEDLLKRAYSRLCTEIFREIKGIDIPGIDHIEGGGWVKQYDEECKIATWTFVDTEAKASERTGSDGRLVVKIFDQGSYDYVKTSDYLDLGNLMYEAVEKRLTNKYFKDEDSQNQFKDWLALQKNQFKKEILKRAQFDLNIMRSGNLPDKLKEFNEKHAQAKEILQQIVVNLAESLRRVGNHDFNEVIDDIKMAEKEYIADTGRPAIIKIGIVGAENNLMVSAQFPQGKRTLPSSMRSGTDQVKLSNHVNDCSGIINDRGDIEVRLVVNGHSSPPPIDEPNEMIQRQVAYQAVMEKLTEATRNIFWAGGGVRTTNANPLPMSFSSMTLLTPVSWDKLERRWRKSESENSQMAITHLVMECLRRRSAPVKINNPGSDSIYIKPDFTYMNLPVNLKALTNSAIGGGAIQNYINERGFYECCLNIEAALRSRSTREMNFNQFLTTSYYDDKDIKKIAEFEKIIRDGNAKLNTFYRELEPWIRLGSELSSASMASVKEQINEMVRRLKDIQEIEREKSNKKTTNTYVDKIINKIEKIKTGLTESNVAEMIKKLQDKTIWEIKKIETKLTKSYKDINDIQKAYFENTQKTLSSLIAAASKESSRAGEKENFLLLHRYRKMQDLYYNRKYVKQENVYLFQILYLLTNEAIGRQIEAFCKSAEDRTGWLRVSLLSFLAFNSLFGRDPDFSNPNDKNIYNKFFSAAAHELSASLDNTQENSRARGFNVSGKFTNPDVGMEMGKGIAELAKKRFDLKALRKLQPEVAHLFNLVATPPALASVAQKAAAETREREGSLLPEVSTRNQNYNLIEESKSVNYNLKESEPLSPLNGPALNTAQIQISLVRHSRSQALEAPETTDDQIFDDFSNLLCNDDDQIQKVSAYVPPEVEEVNHEYEDDNTLGTGIVLPKAIRGF